MDNKDESDEKGLILEEWRIIPEFPDYSVSNLGHIFNNVTGNLLTPSPNNKGHLRVWIRFGDAPYTRSVALLVAEAFVQPPNVRCDHVVALDGNVANVRADNLVWRPRGYAWEYVRQLKDPLRPHYINIEVRNINTGVIYSSIAEAGMIEGLLFKAIWKSTYTNEPIFPFWHTFEIVRPNLN